MEGILRKERENLKKSITIGSLIPLFVYLLFATVIVGISGTLTSDDAISGLALFLPSFIVALGALLGVLSMGSSYLTLGYVLREVWFRDFKLPDFWLFSWPAFLLWFCFCLHIYL